MVCQVISFVSPAMPIAPDFEYLDFFRITFRTAVMAGRARATVILLVVAVFFVGGVVGWYDEVVWYGEAGAEQEGLFGYFFDGGFVVDVFDDGVH